MTGAMANKAPSPRIRNGVLQLRCQGLIAFMGYGGSLIVSDDLDWNSWSHPQFDDVKSLRLAGLSMNLGESEISAAILASSLLPKYRTNFCGEAK